MDERLPLNVHLNPFLNGTLNRPAFALRLRRGTPAYSLLRDGHENDEAATRSYRNQNEPKTSQ